MRQAPYTWTSKREADGATITFTVSGPGESQPFYTAANHHAEAQGIAAAVNLCDMLNRTYAAGFAAGEKAGRAAVAAELKKGVGNG